MTKRVYVAGHHGMVGSALVRRLSKQPETELVLRSRSELDLTNQAAVVQFFASERIDEVYLAAARVGGIHANNAYPANFIYDNLMIESNVIHGAHQSGIDRLLLLGSSCIYPKLAEQPMSEESLLSGHLEATNEPYAIAKIAGIKLCESYNRQYGVDFRSAMPTNLYGENDNFHPQNSHVIPAMMKRFHDAKVNGDANVTIWGSGTPMREFLNVDDLASACLHIMALSKLDYYSVATERVSHINVGTGEDCSILELAELIREVVGFKGAILLDQSKPDGTPRKLLSVAKINKLGWRASIPLKEGLSKTYHWFQANRTDLRGSAA
jgi:GDP-L-fucose synthase